MILILIVMEDGLALRNTYFGAKLSDAVLILVVMEDGLVRFDVDIETLQNYGS